MEKNKKYFTIVELDPTNHSQLRIQSLCAEKTNYEKFKNLYDYCFSPKDSYMILDWKNDNEMQKLIQAFDKHTENLSLFDMRKSVYKYLLYQYGKSNPYIWEKLQEELANNYYFILVIEELIEKINNSNDNIYESCFELVYNLFVNKNFNISNKNKKNEPESANLPDINSLFQKYIYILIGKYTQGNNTFVSVVPPNRIDSQILFENAAKHLISLDSFPKKITQDLYLLSLEKNMPFISYFKTSRKYKEKWEKVISSYKEYYPNVNENEMNVILEDLFANQIILSKNITQTRFLRYPLWLIIVLNYQGNSSKECANYLSLLQKQESQQNNSNNLVKTSLLNQSWVFPENLKCNELIDYFKIDEKTKLIKVTLSKGKNKNLLETFLDECIEESNYNNWFSSVKFDENDKNIIVSWKELILKHVENSIELTLKQKLKEIKQVGKTIENETEIRKFFNELIKKELLTIFTFLKNIEQMSNGESIQKELEFDLYKQQSIIIDHDKTDIHQQIYDSIDNNKKISTFLNKFKLKDVDIKKILQMKAKFLTDGNYINLILQIIIKSKEKTGKTTTEKLTYLNSYIQSIIVELKLFYNIQNLIKRINQGVEVEITETNITEENTLLPKLFENLMENVYNTNQRYEIEEKVLKNLYQYSNELARRINSFNIHFLNFKLYFLIFDSVNLNEKELLRTKKDTQTSKYINKLEKASFNEIFTDDDMFNYLKKIIKTNKNKFFVELLKIFYHKYKLQKTQKSSLKEIFSFLFQHPELNYESSVFYNELIKDINPSKFIQNDKKDCKIINENIPENFQKELRKDMVLILKDSEKLEKNEEFLFLNFGMPLLQSVEKYFLSFIYLENISRFSREEEFNKQFSDSIELLKNLNNNLICIQNDGPMNLLKQFIAIAFLKVLSKCYLDSLYSGEYTSYFNDINEFLEINQSNVSVKIIQFYILKLIRNLYANSFTEFKMFNFSSYQLLWTTDLTFKEEFSTNFEYLFFSDWDDPTAQRNSPFCFFYDYGEFLNSTFIPLKKEIFRTTKYDEIVTKVITDGNFEMYIDVILNVILSETWSDEYSEKSEYVEFCSWSKHMNTNFRNCKQVCERKLCFLEALSQNHANKFYSLIIKAIKKARNKTFDCNININDLELIFISLKFALAYILNPFQREEIESLIINDVKSELIKNLSDFIQHSIKFYETQFENIEELFTSFPKIQNLLRRKHINQIKLFMNFLYYRIKISSQGLFHIISQAIEDWPKQGKMIQKYYDFVNYKKERIRNYILDERITPEILKEQTENLKNTEVRGIPVFKYFYYEKFPSWKDFTAKYSSEITKEKYPYIYFFKNQENFYQLILSSNNISQVLSAPNDKQYFDLKYSGFTTLNDLAVYYSKSYIFSDKISNPNLGYLIDYDIDEIEKELSTIEFAAVEKD